ncbi:LOW QUALITY PROTEIN: coiled-coil domain-containing protein 151 [Danio aesculapii]|uniref:LOW QUALITY PROTEIN: coiled-coil domain-containing protein 151 n=1 Tax=Danio aesculapii TaxID=1142201 RepID=UPI0024BFCF5F|nr:LOW QUALITY PROTEIN: coiled-coil domain-containing protein 151 [Danio aesculapii]
MMPGTSVSEGLKVPIHDKISELQRKIQLLEGDRSAYFESSQSAIKKNRENILQLRQENKNLHKKLAESDEQVVKDVFQGHGVEKASFRNMPVKAARTVLEKQVRDKMKKLNAMKHITQKQRQRLEDLKLQYQSMKPHNRSPLPDTQKQEDEEKKLRILENRLEKTQLKCHEAEHLMRGYLKLKETSAGIRGDSYTHSKSTELAEQMLRECELHLQQEQQRRDAAKDHLDRLAHILNTVRAGVQQLSDKLQHIPPMKGPEPQLSPDSDEQILELMTEAEQKLVLLKEELQGNDLATIMKEMEEEEFHATIARKIPQYNTRIQLHEAHKQDPFDDEEDSGDDEGDIITRFSLKHQSQAIIDANTKRKTRIKKRKGKL